MSHQQPFDHPTHFANTGDRQNFQYSASQRGFMLPTFPPGLSYPPFAPQLSCPHCQYAQPPPMMPTPYGQLQAYANTAHVAHQQVAQAPPAPLQTPTPAPQPAPAPKNRPNHEIRPGVFAFQVDVLDGDEGETFPADTDMPWAEFRDHIVKILGGPHKVQLSGRISGEGKWGALNSVEGLGSMMQKIIQKASNARTKAVALEVKNAAKSAPKGKSKAKGKRSRKDDVPPAIESDGEDGAQYKAYKLLSDKTRCEAHHGHCHVIRRGGSDDHYRLSHDEMTFWAKKMSLNEATLFAPLHSLTFDHKPTLKSGRRTVSSLSSVPEVHVTIQNIAADGSTLTSSASAGVSAIASSSSSAISTSHNLDSAPLSQYRPTSVPSASSNPIPSTSNAFSTSNPFRSNANLSALSWGVPIPALQGQNIFPPLSSVIALLASERPGLFWSQFEEFLWEAGVSSSEHILLADPTVLALVGNMGTRQAKVLRNYAKHIVLPALGLNGTYQEDENDDGSYQEDEDNNENPPDVPATRKRPLDLGESVIQSLYKKPRIELADHVAPTLDEYLFVDDHNLPDPEFYNEFAEDEEDEDSDLEEDELDLEDAEGEDEVEGH